MDRDKALEIVQQYVKNKNLINHMIAAECVMRHFAPRFGGDVDEWGLAGLVHDIDVEMTKETPELHGIKGAEILRKNGFSETIIAAVVNHPKDKPEGDNMSKMLYSADQITGLIVAGALIHPDKKLSAVDFNSILKRFNEKRFAAGVNREKIRAVESLGIELEEFIREALVAMSRISQILGL